MTDQSNAHARTHAYTGRTPRALTAEQVAYARLEAAAGRDINSIAEELGVSYSVAWMAIRGKSWSELTDPPPVARVEREPRTCPDCGVTHYHNHAWKHGLCNECYRRTRADNEADRRAARADRVGWVPCQRCTILIPRPGMCSECREDVLRVAVAAGAKTEAL